MTASPQLAELDNGPQSRERERMCVLTREVRPVADLIRFVVGPDGAAVPDLKSKLPGRGVGSPRPRMRSLRRSNAKRWCAGSSARFASTPIS